MRALLPLEHDVEDGVQAVIAGQDAAKLALGHADGVGLVPAPVEDARNQARAPEATGLGRAQPVALLHVETDAFSCHGAQV